MNKAEFLSELTLYLQKMNNSEKQKFIVYYDEIISDYVENGITEEDAVKKIGFPKNIAEELLDSYDSVKFNLPNTNNKILNIILIIIGFPLWGSILLSVVLFVISIYIIIWCVPITTGAGCAGFLATSIVGIIGSPFVIAKSASVGILQLGTGIASIGISLLLGIVTIDLAKKIVIVTKKFNMRLTALFKKKVVIR